MSDTPNWLDPESEDRSESVLQRALFNIAPEMPDFSKQIMEQVQQEQLCPPTCQYDFEFISVYFDNMLYLDFPDPHVCHSQQKQFDQHLGHCTPCQDSLGTLVEFTRAYHLHATRLEKQLQGWDISHQVLAQWQREQWNTRKSQKRWIPLAVGTLAAGLLLALFVNPSLNPMSPLPTQNELLSRAPQRTAVYTAMYASPEAYVFSNQSDGLAMEKIAVEHDVSTVLFSEYADSDVP